MKLLAGCIIFGFLAGMFSWTPPGYNPTATDGVITGILVTAALWCTITGTITSGVRYLKEYKP